MKRYPLILAVIVVAFLNGCAESFWYLSRESPLPEGLRADAQTERAAATASHIELWIYAYDPPVLRFYDGPDEVLACKGSQYREPKAGETNVLFFVRFNGVESGFRRVAAPNVVQVVDNP